MNKLSLLYQEAVEHTKNKIKQDMISFLETKDQLPTYEQYLVERNLYHEQLWTNVWLNLITSKVPKAEKKRFLSKLGYEVVGVDRKIINKLFRNVMRDYQPFDTIQWLKEAEPTDWNEMYEKAREDYFVKKEQQILVEKRRKKLRVIEDISNEVLQENEQRFYLYIRHQLAQQLASDLETNKRFDDYESHQQGKLVVSGVFTATDYRLVSDFTEELTGDNYEITHFGQNYLEFETYYHRYERHIAICLVELLTEKVNERLAQKTDYEEKMVLTTEEIEELNSYTFQELVVTYMGFIQEEYVSHLLHLAQLPFAIDVHLSIYESDILDRKRIKQEELAQIEKKKAQETMMLDDIFGREYRASGGRSTKYVLHMGETNTGKTFQALERMKQADSGIYLAPLRLLALEVYEKLNKEGVPCSLKTGEEEKEMPDAKHISCTVEMFYAKEQYDVVVIDESQLIADKDRGFSWYKAITTAVAKEVHIIGSRNVKHMIQQLLGDSNLTIHEYSRDIPLQVEKREFNFNQTKKGDALVCFSRKRVLETASRLQNDGHSVSMIYGSMPPETRKKQIQRFIDGETKVIVATDAIGMGLNLPIRRIVFLETEKFDGVRRRRLTSQEVKQIAGRAGRKGIYEVGKVAFAKDVRQMKRLLLMNDEPVQTFAIAPTNTIFERFQKYSRDLGTFFDLWKKFTPPYGTKKATLIEERELYETIRDTQIEARLSMNELYHFLHLPFSRKEHEMIHQWRETMMAIVRGKDLPEPVIKRDSLEELELSYKALGLHLLFLYRLDKRTEAYYWERVRQEISDEVHERLKTDVKKLVKKCYHCGRRLQWDHSFRICDSCHWKKKNKV